MNYFSTRNSRIDKTFDQIKIEGLSADGGLFMPKSWPKINLNNLIQNKGLKINDKTLEDSTKIIYLNDFNDLDYLKISIGKKKHYLIKYK